MRIRCVRKVVGRRGRREDESEPRAASGQRARAKRQVAQCAKSRSSSANGSATKTQNSSDDRVRRALCVRLVPMHRRPTCSPRRPSFVGVVAVLGGLFNGCGGSVGGAIDDSGSGPSSPNDDVNVNNGRNDGFQCPNIVAPKVGSPCVPIQQQCGPFDDPCTGSKVEFSCGPANTWIASAPALCPTIQPQTGWLCADCAGRWPDTCSYGDCNGITAHCDLDAGRWTVVGLCPSEGGLDADARFDSSVFDATQDASQRNDD